MLNKIKEFIENSRQTFLNAGIFKKILYIILASVICIFMAVICKLLWEILPLILIPLFIVGLDKWEEKALEQIQKSNYQPEVDFDAICDCMQEAICASATLLKLQQPISSRSIISAGYPATDGIPRWWFRVKKKESQFSTYEEQTVQDILLDELEQAFLVNRSRFYSDIKGLYLDACKDKQYFYELAVIPVNRQTLPYVSRKIREAEEKSQSGSLKLPEATFSGVGIAMPFLQKDAWIKKQKKLYIPLDLDVYPHIGIFGATGAGKTWCIKYLSTKLLLAYINPECLLSVADWKGQDYAFLEGCRRYYNHENYGHALIQFQELLEARINGASSSLRRCILVLDEWNNFLTSLPKKEQDKYLNSLSYCLNMGRSYHMHIIIGAQAAHAEFFGKARDSLSCVIGLGQISKVTAQMLFTPYTEEKIVPQPRGCGYLLFDGRPLQTIIIPYTDDMDTMEFIMKKRCS